MDFLDNAVSKAKEAIDVACKKTNEIVSNQKQKFDVVAIENKRAKDFEALGKLYFDMIKDTEVDNETVNKIVAEIKEKNSRIDALKEEINAVKNKKICPQCGSAIDKMSVYCNICGAKLEFENE